MIKDRHREVPAGYAVLIKDGKVLLIRRFNTGFEDGNYSMIAGHVDQGESFLQCIVREAEEEAGIKVKFGDLKVAHVMQRITSEKENNERVDMFFVADKWEGTIENKEPNKCDDVSWHSLDNLPSNTIPYIRQALECINKKIFYSEFGWK